MTTPLRAGESPRAKPVMIPTHTSRAPAAAVGRIFESWLIGSGAFPKGPLRVPRGPRASGQFLIHPIAWKVCSANFSQRGFSKVRIWPRSDGPRNPRLALPLPASSRTSPFLPAVAFAVAGLQGGRVAHQRREDVQVEEGREGTLGALVVFYRGRVAVAQGVVFVALLPLRSFAHWPPLLGFLGFAFPCPRATVGVSSDRPAEHGLPTLQAISSIHR